MRYLAISAATSASICCSLASLKVLNEDEDDIGNIRPAINRQYIGNIQAMRAR